MEAMQFEPMSVGRVFDRTFTIYRNNFLRFITIVAIIQVPIALLSLVSFSFLSAGVPVREEVESEPTEDETQVSPATDTRTEEQTESRTTEDDIAGPMLAIFGCLGTVISFLLALVGGLLSQAALTRSVSEVYMGREISVGQAYRAILPRFLSLLGATILVTLIIWFGFLLLVVPGVIFALWLFLTTPSIVVENHGAISGMGRSKTLVSGNLGKAFAVGFVALLITWIIALPLGVMGNVAAAMLIRDNIVLGTFVSQFFNVLGRILSTPVTAAASILLYYDLRIRKEGFDLQMLAQDTNSGQG